MTAIGDDLRAVIKRARTNPVRWGRPDGLRQEDLAEMTNRSTVWIRQIESGYKDKASANVLGNICYALGIDADYLRGLGYPDIADIVADCVDAAILLRETQTTPGGKPQGQASTEQYLRNTPGLTDDQREQLVEALRDIKRTEPIGRDLWRRRGA